MKGLKLRKRLADFLVVILRTITFTRKNTFREFVIENTVKSIMIVVFRPFLKLFRHTDWRLTTDKVEAKYDRYAGSDELNARYYTDDQNKLYCHIDGTIKKMRWIDLEERKKDEYCQILSQFEFKSILEVGAGEMSTMIPVMKFFGKEKQYYSMDLSLNRLIHGREEIKKRGGSSIELCKADAVSLPYPDNCFDVVFTSHCLEHIPYNYKKVIDEMVRVSKRTIVLFEPTYELDNFAQKIYMIAADYVRGIPGYVKSLKNLKSREPFPLDHGVFLNRTSCHIISREQSLGTSLFKYVCPICKSDLIKRKDCYLFCGKCEKIYFIFDGIPILDAKYSFYIGTKSAPGTVVRLAKKEDARAVWEIRNHPQIRSVSTNTEPMSFESHDAWFNKQYFQSQGNICLVMEVDGLVAGYCRFDFKDPGKYRNSIALNPAFQGQGLGTKLLEEGLGQLPKDSIVMAEIEKGNEPSLKFFQKFGFRIVKSDAQYHYLNLPMSRRATGQNSEMKL